MPQTWDEYKSLTLTIDGRASLRLTSFSIRSFASHYLLHIFVPFVRRSNPLFLQIFAFTNPTIFTMKTSIALALAAAKLVASHATFQSFVIGGKDQGQHTAVRTPSNGNNPIMDPSSTAMICNGGSAAADTIEVAAGSEITMQWHHNDPATASGDSDEPIAAVRIPTTSYLVVLEANVSTVSQGPCHGLYRTCRLGR